MTAVLDAAGGIRGIFTDGDLRRTLQQVSDVAGTRVGAVMSRQPRTIRPDALAAEAVDVMETHKVSQLLVVDAAGALVGALNMHDLFRAKVI
jgi:arabinose-5-phosphate isomerase